MKNLNMKYLADICQQVKTDNVITFEKTIDDNNSFLVNYYQESYDVYLENGDFFPLHLTEKFDVAELEKELVNFLEINNLKIKRSARWIPADKRSMSAVHKAAIEKISRQIAEGIAISVLWQINNKMLLLKDKNGNAFTAYYDEQTKITVISVYQNPPYHKEKLDLKKRIGVLLEVTADGYYNEKNAEIIHSILNNFIDALDIKLDRLYQCNIVDKNIRDYLY